MQVGGPGLRGGWNQGHVYSSAREFEEAAMCYCAYYIFGAHLGVMCRGTQLLLCMDRNKPCDGPMIADPTDPAVKARVCNSHPYLGLGKDLKTN